MIVAAVKADLRAAEIKADTKREKDAERQRKSRTNRGLSRNVTVTPRDKRDVDPVPPNDIYSNPPENPDGAKAPHPPFSEKVVLAWNDGPAVRGATRANPLDAGRRKALSLRVKDHGEAAVLEAIGNLAASEFHCGKNDRGWRVNIGWMLKNAENFAKALEMGGGKPGGPPAAPIDHAAYLAKLDAKPWLRGNQTTEPPPKRNPTHGRGPAPIADLIHRIQDHAA